MIVYIYSNPVINLLLLSVLYLLSPVECPNKPILDGKKKYLKKKVLINGLIFLVLNTILYYTNCRVLSCVINLSVSFIVITAFIGYISYNTRK